MNILGKSVTDQLHYLPNGYSWLDALDKSVEVDPLTLTYIFPLWNDMQSIFGNDYIGR